MMGTTLSFYGTLALIIAYILQSVVVSGDLASKRMARMAAVQVMYWNDIAGEVVFPDCIDDFIWHFIRNEQEYEGINLRFFRRLVGRFGNGMNFEELLNKSMENDKGIHNLPVISLSIMKVAAIEMVFEKTDIPIIINEYIEISKSFVDRGSAKLINALLDRILKLVER